MAKKAVGLLFIMLLLCNNCIVKAEPSASTTIAETHTIDYVGNKIYEDGALFAESTNGGVQPYKYNGKELDRMHGLDWYDHGARHNDAAIGRWHVMDPLCEKYYDVSPYAYCAGDPVNAIDPDGKSIWTKILKATMKIGSRVASNGLKELGKAATYADAISDIKENATTVVDGNASTIDRIGAGVSLASELLPISVGDVKDIRKTVGTFGKANRNKKTFSLPKSINQLQKDVERGKAPKEIDRFDKGKGENEKPHVYFVDGTALNKDGTLKHGEKLNISNKTKKYLEKNDWNIYKKE